MYQSSLALLFCLILPVKADGLQEQLVGSWQGVLSVGEANLHLVFKVSLGTDGALSGLLDSPDEGLSDLAFTPGIVDGKVKFHVVVSKGYFLGSLSADGSKLTGAWFQTGSSFPLELERGPKTAIIPAEIVRRLIGEWQGSLKVGAGSLRVVFIFKSEQDALTVTMDSPDQGARGIPMLASYQASQIKLDVPAAGGSFLGVLSPDGQSLKGDWSQMGRSLPLELQRSAQAVEDVRGQDPLKPYPYLEEEVSFQNDEAALALAGTLTLPPGSGPFPGVVLVSGSGPQNRNEEILGHKPFLVLADYLTRQGLAVLRYDDRGVGSSKGDFATATTVDFANDTRSAVRYLKGRREIDSQKIGIIGHSEGGLIGPMVASQVDNLAFIVLMAGPGVDGRQIILEQTELIYRTAGIDEKLISANKSFLKPMFAKFGEAGSNADFSDIIREALREARQGLSPEEQRIIGLNPEQEPALLATAANPWYRYFLLYDPEPALRKVHCPVLALFGEKDLQVPPKQNQPPVSKAIEAAGNPKSRIEVFAGLNHLFQTADTGAVSEYASIKETLAPQVLELIGAWIHEVVK